MFATLQSFFVFVVSLSAHVTTVYPEYHRTLYFCTISCALLVYFNADDDTHACLCATQCEIATVMSRFDVKALNDLVVKSNVSDTVVLHYDYRLFVT